MKLNHFNKLSVVYIAVAFCISFSTLKELQNESVIDLPYGKIQGHILKTLKNNSYYAFQEIPYALPPVGELRFKEAQSLKHWSGVLTTVKNTKICPQGLKEEDPRENEDCLYLNVFKPKLLSLNVTNLPVLVYFYGGMFRSGEPTLKEYDFQKYIDQEIIVVTFNYRSGPLGFLTTEDGVIPANLALKDQHYLLQWVKTNIALFGGDPSKVTIMGHSTGAACVHFQVLSKKSKGLFRSAIIQSYSAIFQNSVQRFSKYFAFELGKKLSTDFTSQNSSEDLLRLLRGIPARKLMTTILEVPNFAKGSQLPLDFKIYFRPTMEDPKDDNSFISGPLHDNIKDGKFNYVSILTGITSEEMLGSQEMHRPFASKVDTDPRLLVHHFTNIKEENKLLFGIGAKNIYTKGSFQNYLPALIQVNGDIAVSVPIIRHADLSSQYTDVYFYQFSYDGPMGGRRHMPKVEGLGKVGHTEELPYVNYYRTNPKDALSKFPASDLKISEIVTKLWGNFIKYQNPTPGDDPLLNNIKWPKLSRNYDDDIIYLDIDTNLTIQKNPRHYNDWKTLMDKYYEHPVNTI